MNITFSLFALALLPSLVSAQRSEIPRDQLYFAAQDDGSPQVRGRTYKAEFRPDGATFVPYCGAQAPQNHPLTFRIQGITSGGQPLEFADAVAAGLEGNEVRYARGSVTEVYALGLEALEQKFVFESLPSRSELVVRIACETGMSAAVEAGAIVFESADGSVRYGAATALDARGKATPAETRLVEGGLEIRVPADFLARASFPVTIDPVITSFDVFWGATSFDDFAPAITWDETNQRYCTVMEEVFSAADHDVIYVFSDPAGAFLYAGYVNLGAEYWANPDVANNNMVDQFFVVAEVGSPSGGARTIHGMTLGASTAVLGPNVELSVGDSGDQVNPSVGGDPYLGASYYSVVWQRINIAGYDEDIHARLMDTNSVLAGAGPIYIDNTGGTLDRRPRISKSCQNSGVHHVVWERWPGGLYSDVYAAQLSWSGAITIGSTPLLTGATTSAPSCSPIDNGSNWVLVCQSGLGTNHDIYGLHLNGMTVNAPFNLSFLEDPSGVGTLPWNQVNPTADTDGNHFAVCYSEQLGISPTDYDIQASTIELIAGTVRLGEARYVMPWTNTHENFPRMCSQSSLGGSGSRMGIAWSDDTAGPDLRNVRGSTYEPGDFVKLCTPGVEGVISCPCGNPPQWLGHGCNNSSNTGGAAIWGFGRASLAADTVWLHTANQKPSSASLVTQGSAFLSSGAGFGQGVRCAGGSLKRLYLKAAVSGEVNVPGPGDLSLSARSAALGDPLSPGSIRYYFVYYRDPVVLGGCPSSAGFNSTDTLQAIWRL